VEMGTGQEGKMDSNAELEVDGKSVGNARASTYTHTHTDGQCKNIMFPAPVCWMSGGIKYPEEPNVFSGR